ncbi:MAG: hypothetical protein WC782_03305 [Methylococcaceae bacterium]
MRYIQNYVFPLSIKSKLKNKHPHLGDIELDLVFVALRDYFYICLKARHRMVSMPSQIVDDAWHEFILFTRSYEFFCNKALKRFLHHTPAEAMSSQVIAQEGIKRAWRLACNKANINAKSPTTLPLLFAIDAQLGISNGFIYKLNCEMSSYGYCCTHIGCGGGCSSGCGGDGSGDGCGGGCGGD